MRRGGGVGGGRGGIGKGGGGGEEAKEHTRQGMEKSSSHPVIFFGSNSQGI